MHMSSPWRSLTGRSLAGIWIDPSSCTSGFESMNSIVKSFRDVAFRSFRPLSPIREADPSARGEGASWKNARVLASAWEISRRNASTGCVSRSPAMATSSRGFHASGSDWQYNFMGADFDLQRLPRLLIVQPRVLPRELLKAKLKEAIRLVDSLEELRGSDEPVEVKGKQRQSPFVLVQSPSSKRVSAGNPPRPSSLPRFLDTRHALFSELESFGMHSLGNASNVVEWIVPLKFMIMHGFLT